MTEALLVAEADLKPLNLRATSGRYSAKLDSYVVIHDRERAALQRDERLVELDLPPTVFEQALRTGLPIRREFRLSPGSYQAAVVLRDRASGLIGSVRHEFEVPAASLFRISTPIVTDTAQPGAAGTPGRPVPIARRNFQAGRRILAAFDVYGAQPDGASGVPRVSVAYSLRRADGTDIAGIQPQPLKASARGEVPVALAITLPDASGEHDLVVTVRDDVANRTIEDREALVITPR